mmetsp:Transcript_94318/g.250468  ORF Transcript_94318/g.250468 Transcript_94318/m.250468 type:complete len:233 (+) Transcript_94318:1318-2016(+)
MRGLCAKPLEDGVEDLRHCVVKYEEEDGARRNLEGGPVLGMVDRGPDSHREVRHHEEEGVQGADVVDDVRVVHRQAEKEHEEVHAPDHLQYADEAVVLLGVEEGDIPKPGHPKVASDVHPDVLVGSLHLPIVVLDKQELHPALPLLRLVPVHEVGARALAQRQERDNHKHAEETPIHAGAVELLRLLRVPGVLRHEAEGEDAGQDGAATEHLQDFCPELVARGPMQRLHIHP